MSLPVGARVGPAEGMYVGIAVGDIEGRMVVGGEVGKIVVGDRVGHIVGDREGDAVDFAEGTIDGAAGTAEQMKIT